MSQLNQTFIPGCLHNDVMECHIRLCNHSGILGSGRFFKGIACLLQLGFFLIGNPFTGKLRAKSIQCPAYFQYIL